MRFIRLSIAIFLFALSCLAQIKKPAKWAYNLPKTAKVGEVVEVGFVANLDPKWHIYSSELKVEGPIATEFKFDKSDAYEPIGKIKPVGFHDFYEEVWGGNTSVAETKGTFVQKFKILKANPSISGTVTFQLCNDSQCLPPEDVILNTSLKTVEEGNKELGTKNPTISNDQYPISNSGTPPDQSSIAERRLSNNGTPPDPNPKPEIPNPKSEESLWAFLLACFGGGWLSIFMPCIYPIMPMTVNFFTRQQNGRVKALIYGLSIILIYTLFGFIVSLAFGPNAANFISTHWIPNLIFFIVFVAFGLSFLGLFEISLPSKLVNDIDKQSDREGLVGIFFMALTLVVVSFSCTAPIASSLLVQSAGGKEFLRPILGMVFFALPFALVFGGLAMFPSLLKTLPKSGGWLNEFKVVFGLVEFALALKFLSNIDLAYRWQILDREIYLALWIVIFSLIGFYVMGKIRTEKDSEVKYLSIPRIMIAVATFSFVVYMIPGMFGAPLRGLSGWLPPEQTQDFYLRNNGIASAASDSKQPHFPHGLQGYFDYDEALAEAKKQSKPLFVDFTGFACANCREMEANVWPKPEVLEKLKNDFVLVSLYVDDRTELPKNQRYVSKYDNKEKTTVGAKNTDLQITKFNNNAQPYYCLLDGNGNSLTPPVGTASTEGFVKFLETGIANFRK